MFVRENTVSNYFGGDVEANARKLKPTKIQFTPNRQIRHLKAKRVDEIYGASQQTNVLMHHRKLLSYSEREPKDPPVSYELTQETLFNVLMDRPSE